MFLQRVNEASCNSPLIHRFLPMTHKRFSSIWILVWYCLDSDICANLRQLFFSNIEHTDETFPLGFDPPQITGLPLKSEPEVELVKDWVAKSRLSFLNILQYIPHMRQHHSTFPPNYYNKNITQVISTRVTGI